MNCHHVTFQNHHVLKQMDDGSLCKAMHCVLSSNTLNLKKHFKIYLYNIKTIQIHIDISLIFVNENLDKKLPLHFFILRWVWVAPLRSVGVWPILWSERLSRWVISKLTHTEKENGLSNLSQNGTTLTSILETSTYSILHKFQTQSMYCKLRCMEDLTFDDYTNFLNANSTNSYP